MSATKSWRTTALTMTLWALTSGLGAVCIQAVQNIVLWLVSTYYSTAEQFSQVQAGGVFQVASTVALMITGILWLIVVIGGGDYHYKHAGQPRSQRILAITLGIELVLAFVGIVLLRDYWL